MQKHNCAVGVTATNVNDAAGSAALTHHLTLEEVDAKLRECRNRRTYWRKKGRLAHPEGGAAFGRLMQTFDEIERDLLAIKNCVCRKAVAA